MIPGGSFQAAKGGAKRRICVSVGEKSVEQVLETVSRIEPLADVIEIRLDYLGNPNIQRFLERITTPLLFTNRPSWEGGEYGGSEEERILPLIEAGQLGAAYVDLELATADKLRATVGEALQNSPTQLILSSHDFSQTASSAELVKKLKMMKEGGAAMGKLITTAHEPEDALRVLHLLDEAERLELPLIAFCMGKAGAVTRVATCDLGGYMTYCSAARGAATAPGQIDAQTMQDIFSRF